MILVTLTVNNVDKRVSTESLNLEHHWYPFIEDVSAPQYQMATDYGGFCKLGFGSITILPSLFLSDWPPPVQCPITVQYTASTEAAAVTLFESTAHLNSYSRDKVVYDIRELEYGRDLLTEIEDYDGNVVALPRGFGTVTHARPVRIPDVDIGGGYGNAPTYHLGGLLSASTAKRIIGYTYHSAGNTTVHIGDIDGNALNHGWANGTTVYISDSTNFDGGHTIANAAGSTFTIAVEFAEEGLPAYGQAYEAGAIQVFDDGYPIPENFYDNGDGTFSLKAVPVGEVTISGTASETTLTDVLTWAYTRLDLSTLTTTYARDPSPAVNHWADSQQPLIDFISELCAVNTHCCYVTGGDTLVVVDMYRDNGSTDLTEFDFFEQVEYARLSPVKTLTSEWSTFTPEIGFASDDDVTQELYLKETEHKITETVYEYGNEEDIKAFHDDEALVRSALVMIKNILKRDHVTIRLPFSGSLPAPGEKLSWTDGSLPTDIPGYIRARHLAFDFNNVEVQVTGDGEFLRPPEMGALI